MGLAITRRLAEMMGGHAGAESALGQGSTFWFTVRLNKAMGSGASLSLTQPAGQAELALKASFSGQRVLVVEDDALNREVVRLLLDGVGLVYDLAENGALAVEMAARQHYALILMDVQMPQMGGIEATRIIRAADAEVPIIAMTANAFAEDRERCLAAGINDFLTKPFELDKLFATLLKWLKQEGGKDGGQNP
ncbi:MAG: response regulator [Burkholderiales bacterium]|nr:response regulator [Burkholderiales bacterium]